MKLSVDDYVQGFLNPTIPPIVGRPTFATLLELSRLLKQNAGGVPSNDGDGTKGLIRLVVSETSYANISTVDFVIPTNPGNLGFVWFVYLWRIWLGCKAQSSAVWVPWWTAPPARPSRARGPHSRDPGVTPPQRRASRGPDDPAHAVVLPRGTRRRGGV